MILLRQKSFTSENYTERMFANPRVKRLRYIRLAESTKPTKAYAGVIRAINKPKAAVLDTLAKTTGLPSLEKKAKEAKILTTRSGSSKKSVLDTGKSVEKTKKLKTGIERSIMEPGKTATKVTEAAIRNPVIAAGEVIGKVQLTSPDPLVVAFPTRPLAIGTETVLKKIPAYKKITSGLADKIQGSRFERGMENFVNAGVGGLRYSLA